MYVMITFVWMKVYPTGNNDKVIDMTLTFGFSKVEKCQVWPG